MVPTGCSHRRDRKLKPEVAKKSHFQQCWIISPSVGTPDCSDCNDFQVLET
jgi:hypothetical protein